MVQQMNPGPSAFWTAGRAKRGLRANNRLIQSVGITKIIGIRRKDIAIALAAVAFTGSVISGVRYGESLKKASSASASLVLSTPLRVPMTVRRGDSLWRLAQRYGNPQTYIQDRVDAIARANSLSASEVLQPGQRLIIPVENPIEIARIQQHLALR